MPNLNGLEATREILRFLPQVKILIVSQHDSPEIARQAVKAGAKGYLVKSSLSRDLLAALQETRQESFFGNSVLKVADTTLDAQEILQRSVAFERALRESESRFRTMADTVPALVWMSGTDTLCTFFNKPWLDFRGRTIEQELGNGWTEGVHPDDLEKCVQTYLSSFHAREPFSMEYRLKRFDGQYRWILDRGVPRHAEDGQFAGYIGSCIDISDHKQIEQELLATTTQFQLVTDVMAAAVTRCSRDLRYVWVNPRYAEWIGQPTDQIVGRPIVEVLGPAAFERLRSYFELVLSGHNVEYEEEVTFQGIGRRWISASYTPTFDSAAAIDGWVASVVDITERKKAEAAMATAEERFRLAIEAAPNAMMMVDSAGCIVLVNAQTEKLFGYTRQELIGRPVEILVPVQFRTAHPNLRGAFVHAPQARLMGAGRDLYGLRKDGSQVPIEIGLNPLDMPEGQFVLSSIVDITERKKAEAALVANQMQLEDRVKRRTADLQKIREQLERKNSELVAQADMVRTLSGRLLQVQDEERRRIARELHDGVGQLLAAMSMNAAIVDGEKWKLNPDTARCAEETSRLIEQASADIRTMSYLFHPPLLDEMGLESALKWYIDGFAERSKIAATLEHPPDWERLPQDYELCLFRIAQECLTNIHRHSGSSTALVKLLRSDGEIRLEVSDEGRGINQEIQSKIASGESAGVGLRGMQERVRQLGGSLEVRSNGHGATLIATVPFEPSAQSVATLTDDRRK
jgi:PAS domain S-box-containing protein